MRKPILIGGLGLSILLGLGSSISGLAAEWSQDALMLLMLLGGGFWWLKAKPRPNTPIAPPPDRISPEAVQLALNQAEQTLNCLAAETTDAIDPAEALRTQLDQLQQVEPSAPLSGAIIGSPRAGKTSLYQQLASLKAALPIAWQDSPPESTFSATDLLLYLVTGDLTDSELKQLQTLRQAAHPVCLLLSKQDQQPQTASQTLVNLVQQRVEGLISAENVIRIAAAPQAIALRQHQADGTVMETTTTPEPQLEALSDRLQTLTSADAQTHLRRATQWRQLRQLTQQMHHELNQLRRDRALPLVERYQWLAAGAAIANPVAALDLLAAIAINTQMIIDLGGVYRCTITLDQAQTVTRELGELLLKLGAVEFSTQTLGHLAKSSPVTYLAGGAIQGVSAAYLTRIVGLSLIDYFAEQDPLADAPAALNLQRLGAIVQQWLTQTQRLDLLKSLAKQLPQRGLVKAEG
ncbi:MAG: YcjF family protein [Spirulinaceae cyanobacterium]